MASRQPREPFYLIFSSNPPAADIVKKSLLVPLDVVGTSEFDAAFKWEKSKNVIEIVQGQILDQGFKKDMVLRKVSSTGVLITEVQGVGARKQEIEKIKMRQVNAQKLQLQERAEDMLDEGEPDMVLQKHNQPEVRVRSRLPLKRSAERLQELQTKVDNLPCLKAGPAKTRLWRDADIYLPSGDLTVKRLRYKKNSKKLFRALLHLALPVEILLENGFSATGKRFCVGPPKNLLRTLCMYVGGVYKKAAGGDVEELNFDAEAILGDLIRNTRRAHKMYVHNDNPPASSVSTVPDKDSLTQDTDSLTQDTDSLTQDTDSLTQHTDSHTQDTDSLTQHTDSHTHNTESHIHDTDQHSTFTTLQNAIVPLNTTSVLQQDHGYSSAPFRDDLEEFLVEQMAPVQQTVTILTQAEF